MPNYSNATIVGHLGRDAEVKPVGERNVINFSVAVTRKVKEEETTTWWRVAYWTKSAVVAQYLTKGTAVLVSGEPYLRPFEKKDGTKDVSLEIDAKEVRLMGGKPEGQSAAPAQAPRRPAAAPDGGDEADCPF